VRALSKAKWIRVVGQAEANGGRPAMLYGINDSYYLIIGVHLQLPGLRLITTNLSGTIVDEADHFQGVIPTPNQSVAVVTDYISRIRTNFPERCILGIGIATPGFIDLNAGDIISIGRVPSWLNFPICRQLQAVANVPVQIANDIDCMAIAEFQYIGEPLEKNMAYVGFDEGVKVSIFLKGELYKGSLGNTGLIASHLLPICEQLDLQDINNLLTIRGFTGIFEQRVAALDEKDRELYAHITSASDLRKRIRLIFDEANEEMPVCHQLVHDLTWVLSVAIANVLHIVQPDVVVMGGLINYLPKNLFAELENAIRNQLPSLISNNTIFQQGKLISKNGAALGANHHFLRTYLSNSANELL
jgi:glucokinase